MSITRRGFLKGVVGAGLAAVFGRKVLAETPKPPPPADYKATLREPWYITELSEPPKAPSPSKVYEWTIDIPVRSLDVPRLLRCIAEKETRNRDSLVGASGERSRYQIKQSVWHRYEVAPFAACRGERAYCVALRHVNYLRGHLNGTDSVYLVARTWNAGLAGSSRRARDYATCVENLYNDPSFVG